MEQYLCNDGLLADVINDKPASTAAIISGLESDDPLAQTAAALLAGQHGVAEVIPQLISLLDDDDLPAHAARYSLGLLPSSEALIAFVADGASLDQRENAYAAIAAQAARGTDLSSQAEHLLQAEITLAQAGRSALGEHVLQILAVAGADITALGNDLIAQDSFADRFEIQRMIKAVSNDGVDKESIAALTSRWEEREVFADVVTTSAEIACSETTLLAAINDDDVANEATETSGEGDDNGDSHIAAEQASPDYGAESGEMADGTEPSEPTEADGAGEAPQAIEIDWDSFLSSEEITALDETQQQLVGQLGPMLDQLCRQVTGRSVAQLKGEELAGLILQVLPQALPPQMVQAALSPQAIKAMKIFIDWLISQELADEDLVNGIQIVREQLQEQIRASGMLGGPSYMDD